MCIETVYVNASDKLTGVTKMPVIVQQGIQIVALGRQSSEGLIIGNLCKIFIEKRYTKESNHPQVTTTRLNFERMPECNSSVVTYTFERLSIYSLKHCIECSSLDSFYRSKMFLMRVYLCVPKRNQVNQLFGLIDRGRLYCRCPSQLRKQDFAGSISVWCRAVC